MLHVLKAVDLSTCNLHIRAQHELIIKYQRTWQNLAKCGHQFCIHESDRPCSKMVNGISTKEMPIC